MINSDSILTIVNLMQGYRHHWVYTENGNPIMAVARYDFGLKKTYRQFCFQKGEWVVGMPPSPYPLYGLSSLTGISSCKEVLITEGEKCANVLHQLNWPSISTVLGAQNPSSSDWNPMRHYTQFIILRDNDKAGISFSRLVANEIRKIRPDGEIYVVNLTPNIDGGDLIDWLQSTILRSQNWNGFGPIPNNLLQPTNQALQKEINDIKVRIEDCPKITYKPIEAMFENAPTNFKIELEPVPQFPLHTFPEKISKYLTLTSSQYSQVPDFAATAFITCIGGLIGRSIHLRMRPNDVWMETSNCWCILIGPPSAKKSPIMRRIFNLFKPLESAAAAEFALANKIYKSKKRQAEIAKADFEDELPTLRRYITDDSTTAKLRDLMAANQRGIILRNDELKGQLERLDKPINEGDRSFMMSSWSGLETYTEDRMCRDSKINIPIALTWIGCIPPSPLQRYLREAMGRGSGADGFMQRFQFVCYPDLKTAYKLPDEFISQELALEIQELFSKIDVYAKDSNRTLMFSKEAQKRFDEWLEKHENYCRFGGHPGHWESHLGKQHKTLAVLVIVLHRINEVLTNTHNDEVQLNTLEAALEIKAYYESHAKRCYESVRGNTIEDAQNILELLKQKRLSPKFKAQDIYHKG